MFLEAYINIKLWCLYLVQHMLHQIKALQFYLWCLYLMQHMLHQIKALQFYTDYLKLISLVMDSSISEVEF